MKESRQTFWVGLFVIVTLVALAGLIVMFGGSGLLMRRGEYVLNVRFERAPGVRVGTVVTAGGIPVGRVVDVKFVNPDRFDAGVNVAISLDPPYKLHRGSRAKTNEPGLGEGRPPIRILAGPPDAPLLASGEIIQGEVSSAVEQLIPPAVVSNFDRTATQIGDAAAALTPVLKDVHELLRPRSVVDVDHAGGPPGNLATATERLDSFFKNINDVFGDVEVKTGIKDSVLNLEAMTEDGKQSFQEFKAVPGKLNSAVDDARALIGQASDTMTRLDDHVGHIARATTDDLDVASRVLTRIDTIVGKAEQGQGTLGRMLTDDRLYESLVLTFRRAADALEEFRLLVKEWQKGKIRVAL